MAYINLTMEEFVTFISKNAEYDRDRIRDIRVIHKNQVQLIVNIGPFFPEMKVELGFNRYEKGKIYFNLLSGGAAKMLIGLMNEMGSRDGKNFMKINGQNIVIDIDELISENLEGVSLKEMTVTGNQIYITVKV